MSNRVSNAQLNKLLEFLLKHPTMVKGPRPGVRKEELDKLWDDLATILNSDRSGSAKSGERWKKYWADIKHKSKARMSKRIWNPSANDDGSNSDDEVLELDKKILAIVGRRAFSGDAEHSLRVVDLTPPTTTVSIDADIDISNDMKFVDTLASPSSKDHISKSCMNTEGEAEEDFNAVQTGVESPVSLQSRERSPVRTRNRATTDSNSQNQVSPEWLMELESSRVESERKLAEAALIMAEASRTQAIALKTLVELVQRQSEDTNTLLQLLQDQKTE